jgi:hypothetical protein
MSLTLGNLAAVLAAALMVFVVGGLWYGPLFGKAWQQAAGVAAGQAGHPAKVFGGASAFGVIGAVAVAILAGPEPGVQHAATVGFGCGIAAAAAFGINYLFAARSPKLFAIDAGYAVLLFTAMGAVTAGVRGLMD